MKYSRSMQANASYTVIQVENSYKFITLIREANAILTKKTETSIRDQKTV